MAICAVCARERDVEGNGIVVMPISDVPNLYRLRPKRGITHPDQDLIYGALLEEEGIVRSAQDLPMVCVCKQCITSLVSSSANKPPKYSLANNLWVGRVPWQLRCLTMPEQMLIALLYPRVFVYKLSTKSRFSDPASQQQGMRGTVSTYEQDIKGIARMTEGRLMPRHPEILPSVMTVTFIGQGQLPKDWLQSTFKIRRAAVREALQWLKKHNTKYYGDIEIDECRLDALPEDDVPNELLATIRQSEDVGVLDEETSGYVPREDEENVIDQYNVAERYDGESMNKAGRVSEAVDTEQNSMSSSELMLYALSNVWHEGQEGGYANRHGGRPVQDFGRPRAGETRTYDPNRENFFEKSFPTLFPYGRGGIEADKETLLSFVNHIRWNLQYHDRRFRKHETFPFVAFGIDQRRQTLLSARLQMRRRNFESDARILSSISADSLASAEEEEKNNQPISDPAIRLLRRHVHATGARVQGCDSSRYQLRSQIWATTVRKGPPTVWMTVNPCDLHDPIAQVFAGHTIDMDAFIATAGPDKDQRARTIANDPYAAAKFFHFIIRTVLKTLMNIEIGDDGHVHSGMGVMGEVAAYFGTVESQGRGTLHLHMLLWLEDAPSADELQQLMKSIEFRQRVKRYVSANFRAYVPGLDSRSQQSMKMRFEISSCELLGANKYTSAMDGAVWSIISRANSFAKGELLSNLQMTIMWTRQEIGCAYPGLKGVSHQSQPTLHERSTTNVDAERETPIACTTDEVTDMVTIETNDEGNLCPRSQVVDYAYRGPELDGTNVVDFFRDTYKRARDDDAPIHSRTG
ncbi:hypothetical protein EW146_g8175 [Bondarzewia mesenterica]|uniref:Uncharacterized protein n=1 Tax=Bondarzewia mesenterica TaxID=1095465 RepID=A0A4S4LGI5_9AGAM|nr:hypothetical protein EW146_g8175 [Bondarzewia mesenterica]